MAAALPAKLKTADLQRFAARAAQLEKYRPIVTYWCEYYILNQILSKGLHSSDEECSAYAVQLMDKLETYKSSNTLNDAIIDDVAAKAYIENFALETFNKADEAQRMNKVTRATADTFMASVTFLDLLNIWGDVDKDVAAKSKFAKFHAARILRAFKAGEDPNATNPVVEEPPAPPDDGLEAELDNLERQQNGAEEAIYRPPTVESAPHSGVPSRPQSALPSDRAVPPVLPLGAPSQMAPPPPPVAQQNEYQVSPIEPSDPSAMDTSESASARQNSAGGGYFPALPSAPADVDMVGSPDVPSESLDENMNPQDFYNTAAPPPIGPSAPSPRSLGISSPARPHRPPPDQMGAQAPAALPVQPPAAPQLRSQPTVPAPVPMPVSAAQPAPPLGGYRTDDESTMAAQKHARWAISALNFEDVNTAVRELRLALQRLGAG